MRRLYITWIFFLYSFIFVFGQNADECVNAWTIPDVTSWCSEDMAFSTAGATQSLPDPPGCFAGASQKDIWFSFVAEATTVNISVTGQLDVNAGGNLRLPQFALYTGTCDTLTLVGCKGDDGRNNVVDAFISALNIGATYYIRVSAEEENEGTFRLCVNNYNAVPNINSDCRTGTVLCDKSPFSVAFIDGFGQVKEEIPDVFCTDAIGFQYPVDEVQSTWLRWTIKDPGTLTFTITPLNPDDDIDWALYKLPNGVNDCSNKEMVRYNISGRNVGGEQSTWKPCTGATGTIENDDDIGENCGCQPGDNNFSGAPTVETGEAYTLVIFNFSQSGAGYSIEFGGTSTFLGPEVDFEISDETLCIGNPVTITDASSFSGGLAGWQWNFGQNAEVRTANGAGPHEVTFLRPGEQSVLLTVQATSGCVVSKVKRLIVECCDDHFDASGVVTNLRCAETPDGAIDLTVQNDYGPYLYAWSTGQDSEDLNDLEAGDYVVSVVDQLTCETSLSFTVVSPPPVEIDTAIVMPTCNGGVDGAVTLTVNGGTPDYAYSWGGAPFSSNNSLVNIPIGDYDVTVRDANGCAYPLTIPVRELELILDPAVDAITPPSCTGFSDGSIEVLIDNGRGPYTYDWQDGAGFVDDNSLRNIAAGVYSVEVLDANLCRGNFTFNMVDHPPLELQFDIVDVSCNGLSDGSAAAVMSGGVGNYRYRWSGGSTRIGIENLPAGNYPITVLDGNGCVIEGTAVVPEPPPVEIAVGDVLNVICHGDATGVVTLAGAGGVTPYSFSSNGGPFQTGASFTGLRAGNYTFTIRDAEGCEDQIPATVTEPSPLLVDAGEDQTIELGATAILEAFANEFPVRYQWSPEPPLDCVDCSRAEALPVNTTTFVVTVTNELDCTATDEVQVRVLKNRPIYIPNAFSPNGDGRNNFFTLYGGPGARTIKRLQIYDRWGELVFETQNIPLNIENAGWDGTFRGQKVNNGVFVYVAEVEFIDDEVVTFSGDVAVMR